MNKKDNGYSTTLFINTPANIQGGFMAYNITAYTDTQIDLALMCANVDTAIALWEEKDWQTYDAVRQTLLAVIRSEHGDKIGIPHIQFLTFIHTFLAPRFPSRLPARKLFMSELPVGRSTHERSWEVAKRGDYLRQPI
jgi:hypothetical protein